MSHNEWEAGEVILPTAEFARVRQDVADSVSANSDAIYRAGQKFWSALSPKEKRGGPDHAQALERFARLTPNVPDEFWAAAQLEWGQPGKRIKKDALEFPTARTTHFRAGYEAWIDFNRERHSVSWGTSDNNHAVERARDTAAAAAFFRALDTVKWTRGTGGVLTGNDEYNQDSREDGRGANYTTVGYGPIGAVAAPGRTAPFQMAEGTRVSAPDFPKLQKAAESAARRKFTAARQQSHRPAHSPGGTGGQFDERRYSDPEARL